VRRAVEVEERQTAKQPDLFWTDSPLYGPVKGERTVGEFPFFALTKNPQMEPMIFASDDVRIEINPGKHGIATIWDKEILLYVASLMVAKVEKGEQVTSEVTFTANDFFAATDADNSKKSYEALRAALRRLQTTEVFTDIETGGEAEDGGFSWLLDWRATHTKGPDGERRMKAVKVTVCAWLHRAILRDRRLAAYHIDYFKLGSIERRLYELAMFNCTPEFEYTVPIEELAKRVGSTREIRKFKAELKDIAERDALPQYRLELADRKRPSTGGRPGVDTIVTFRTKPRGLRAGAELTLAAAASAAL
jgi:plasmid replication initiation protein